MSNFVKPTLVAAIMASSAMLLPLHAETYTIKKINTPTIRINDKDMKVGDKFTDGSVVYWSSGSQAMRVLNSHNEPINLRAGGKAKPTRMKTLVSRLEQTVNPCHLHIPRRP